MSKPELKRFIELTKAKSSEVNNNFDLLNNYVESVSVSSLTSYDPTTTYPKGAWIIGGIDNKKTIYESLVDDNKGNALDDERYWKKITLGGGMPVGTIFPHTASATFVPENSLPCDGTEYAQAQFKTLYTDWLIGKKLETCTYTQYQQEITATGECLKFALDTAKGKFKVPTKLNKYVSPNGGGKAPVVGNGKALGFYDGTRYCGIVEGGSNYLMGSEGVYGKSIGTASSGLNFYDDRGIGLTTDSSKTGIEADLSNAIKTKEIRYFVVVATGSIKQSEMDWSQWASSLEGKLNKDHSNDTVPYLKTTYVNGTSGYNIWSNGYCEQWGVLIGVGSSKPVTILKKYKDTNYNIQLTAIASQDSWGASVGVGSKKVNGFNIYYDYSDRSVEWVTRGYLAEGEY